VVDVSDELPAGPVDEPADDVAQTANGFEPETDFEVDAEPGFEPEPAPASARWELPEPTGVPAVDDALAPLVELDDLPTGEHVPHYEAVHRRLQDALADLDSA
jgi:hypothetical protein